MPPSLQTSTHGLTAVDPRILIVDADPHMRRMLEGHLSQNGMRIALAATSACLFDKLKQSPSLVVLDAHLAGSDRFDLLHRLRRESDVPVILVTATHRDEIDRVIALEMGADHYMTKPFGVRELLARIRCILRPRVRCGEVADGRPRSRVRFGPWELNRASRQIQREGETPVPLTKGEFALLHAFLAAPQRTLSREHLLRATRVHEDVFDRSIDVQVLRLRRKLQAGNGTSGFIETVRGAGYIFRAEVEQG